MSAQCRTGGTWRLQIFPHGGGSSDATKNMAKDGFQHRIGRSSTHIHSYLTLPTLTISPSSHDAHHQLITEHTSKVADVRRCDALDLGLCPLEDRFDFPMAIWNCGVTTQTNPTRANRISLRSSLSLDRAHAHAPACLGHLEYIVPFFSSFLPYFPSSLPRAYCLCCLFFPECRHVPRLQAHDSL